MEIEDLWLTDSSGDHCATLWLEEGAELRARRIRGSITDQSRVYVRGGRAEMGFLQAHLVQHGGEVSLGGLWAPLEIETGELVMDRGPSLSPEDLPGEDFYEDLLMPYLGFTLGERATLVLRGEPASVEAMGSADLQGQLVVDWDLVELDGDRMRTPGTRQLILSASHLDAEELTVVLPAGYRLERGDAPGLGGHEGLYLVSDPVWNCATATPWGAGWMAGLLVLVGVRRRVRGRAGVS